MRSPGLTVQGVYNVTPWFYRTGCLQCNALILSYRVSSQSQSHFTTDGQLVSHCVLVSSPFWFWRPDVCCCLTVAVVSLWSTLSDERSGSADIQGVYNETPWFYPTGCLQCNSWFYPTGCLQCNSLMLSYRMSSRSCVADWLSDPWDQWMFCRHEEAIDVPLYSWAVIYGSALEIRDLSFYSWGNRGRNFPASLLAVSWTSEIDLCDLMNIVHAMKWLA
jgi:hypothetical protein